MGQHGLPKLESVKFSGISEFLLFGTKGRPMLGGKGFYFRLGKVIQFSLSCKSNHLHHNLQHPFKTYGYLRKLYLS